MPLRPGRYQATFDLQADSPVEGSCEVTRLFFDTGGDFQLDQARPSVTVPSAPLPGRSGEHLIRLDFTVPEETGPEPILQFRVLHSGRGSLPAPHILLTPLE